MEATTLIIFAVISIGSYLAGWFSKHHYIETSTKQVFADIQKMIKNYKYELSCVWEVNELEKHKNELKNDNQKMLNQIKVHRQQLKDIDEEYRDKKYFLAEQERIAKQEQNNKNKTTIKDLKSKSGNLKINK
jgi:hypothetical protein